MEWNPKIELIKGDVHRKWLKEAYHIAAVHSEDTVTHTGAVIVRSNLADVIAATANHFPHGLKYTKEQVDDREWKYKHIIHAETSAIYSAAYVGNRVMGTVMYMPWVPCTDCAKAIINSGIKTLIGHKELIMKTPERWHESTDYAMQMLEMCGVERFMYEGKIGDVDHLFNGEIWEP